MAEDNYHHLVLPAYDAYNHSTIYKLTLSMKRRLSPQQGADDSQSPVEAGKIRDILRRLVEIDYESRELLGKVFSLLEKDESLEQYVKNRIEDPKVSQMWELVEQVLACQEQDTNIEELIMGEDESSFSDKSVKEKDEIEEEMKSERFKVISIKSDSEVATSTSTSSSTSANNKK